MSKNDVIRQLVDALIYCNTAGIKLANVTEAIAAGEAELAKPEPEILGWTLKWEDVNHLQRDTVELLVQRCKNAHTTDVKLRINGKDEWYEADWLKHLHLSLRPQPEPVIPEGWKLVPTRIDNNMIDAANNVPEGIFGTHPHWQWVWDAMLSSAPDYKG